MTTLEMVFAVLGISAIGVCGWWLQEVVSELKRMNDSNDAARRTAMHRDAHDKHVRHSQR